MDEDIVKGKWKQIKGKVKQQWGKFTDDQIGRMQGNREELEGMLQEHYGYQKDEAKKQVDSFLDSNDWNKREE